MLGFFKYADFAILQFNIFRDTINLNSHFPLLDLALPIGISFYTFQTISYTVDIYRKKLEPSKSFLEFLTGLPKSFENLSLVIFKPVE